MGVCPSKGSAGGRSHQQEMEGASKPYLYSREKPPNRVEADACDSVLHRQWLDLPTPAISQQDNLFIDNHMYWKSAGKILTYSLCIPYAFFIPCVVK
jgi:hypothetical protein